MRILIVKLSSLGETRAAAILLAELRQQLPGMRLLLTHGTATGRAEGEPHRLTAQLQALAAGTFAAPAQINTIDGLRVDWPDGFGLIRASNTTPVLVLRFEGHTPEALARIEAAMLALLHRVKPDAQVGSAAH